MGKYRTPLLEEFIEGFKFEYYGDRDENNNCWYSGIIGKDDKFWTKKCLYNRLYEYSKPLIRIKISNNEFTE